ncbi:uncharacterized protein V6R79_003224 [Siganus canaliculatus]
MGNADSHSSVGGGVSPSGAFRFSSRREEVPSAESWWRSRGRSHWHNDHAPRAARGGARLGAASPQRSSGGSGGGGRNSSTEGGGSPKVLLSKDGSMRVEFTNSRAAPAPVATATDPSHRTSKGSSLSSDGSWYDSPWGGGELADHVFASAPVSPGLNSAFLFPTPGANVLAAGHAHAAAGHTSCSSGRTEDSGIGDSVILQPDLRDLSLASLDDVFASTCTLPAAFPTDSLCSTAPLDDVIQEEAGPGGGVQPQLYSSQTLPGSASSARSSRKDFLKSRIQRLSDWTGSLSRKKRRLQEPGSSDLDSGLCGTLWSYNPLNQNQNQLHCGSSRSLNQDQNQNQLHCGSSRSLNQNQISDVLRQNVYNSFMQELETGCSSAGHTEASEEEQGEEQEEEQEEQEEEQEQGVVRRAGWLSFKPLLSLSRDRKLELAARRRWRRYWVTLRGCTLLFYDTFGRSASVEAESPRYAVLAEDSIVQAVPEHPKREHVFCLSTGHGDVYLLQATSQTDLENWVTAIHSASAALVARRQGTDDTLRLLQRRRRSLLQHIDTDGKMKKMAELQLSVIKEPKSRRAVESQIQQWDQNLEKLNLDLFRVRCYLSSLQGGELPNPKSLLAAAGRASKSMLGRLGVFSVSSFHALVCSRDEAALRTLSGGSRRRKRRTKELQSSLKVLHGLRRRSREASSQSLHCGSDQKEVLPPAGHPEALQDDVFTLNLNRVDDSGFAVTGHVDGCGRSHVFISEVDPLGPSARAGLRVGDEVLAVNGATVAGLDLDLMESVFSHQRLQLLLRRDQDQDQDQDHQDHQDPQGPHNWMDPGGALPPLDASQLQVQDMDRVPLYQTFPQCRGAEVDAPRNPYGPEVVLQPPSPAHLSVCQRLRKVIQELVDTEKSYVKDLVCLLDVYLTPLQNESFLSTDEMEALFGCLPEMLDFQRVFLQTLEQRISSCPNFSRLETPGQFQKLLFSLGGSFLYYADHFKHYSGFCVNHIKVQKVLERAKTDGAFKHFLDARNPTNQHSSSLESYLIKPVQRVLKYPLLLRELVSLTAPESPEHTHLTEALRAMEEVASHINEMQKIYEDYGSVFDQLAAEQGGPHKQVAGVSMGEFVVHSSALWLNPLPSLGRLRKEPELTLFVFKRAVILVYRESTKVKKRMTGSRSADLDPFRFRWLIPVSAVQVRPANVTGSENPCVWELVHSRSEVEGRPETVFQLCSSGPETKASVLRALRLLLRDRAPSGSSRRSSSWRRRQRRRPDLQRTNQRRTEDASGPDGGETCSEPLLPRRNASDSAGRRSRLCSLTSDLEAQLQRLNFSEDQAEDQRRSSSLRRSHAAGDALELLERDFSVQSLTSIINEDCFYDSVLGIPLQGSS